MSQPRNKLQPRDLPAADKLALSGDDVRLITRSGIRKRRNLVVLRANEASLHPRWARDLGEADRSWDLCVSFYGRDDAFGQDELAEYQVLQNGDRKFSALWKLMHVGSPLLGYDYVTFPDDDLDMKWSDLNTLFDVCRQYDLHLAQPSLLPYSILNYHETRQIKDFVLRFVTMVECMMPVFSREALALCAPTFQLHPDGYGVDYAWSRLLGANPTKIAIIDKVGIVHTRFTGVSYDLAAALDQGRRISAMFGTEDFFTIREVGGIYVGPVHRWPG